MVRNNIKSVTNQKIVTVAKAEANKHNPYSQVNLEADIKAMKILSPYGFLLFNYMRNNQNGYKFGLSRKDFCEKTGVSRNSYLKAVKELEEHNYLVCLSENSNQYTFYENPLGDNENIFVPTEEENKIAEEWIESIANGGNVEEAKNFLLFIQECSEELVEYIISEGLKLKKLRK